MFTHYMYNTLAVNPGYAGSRGALTVTALHRSQWIGVKGAPMTQTLTFHSPIPNKNIGLGLSFINDKIGPTNTNSIYADFAYRIKLKKERVFAIGLKGGVNIMTGALSNLEINDGSDGSFTANTSSKLLPNFGAGLYFSTPRSYIGFSAPKLLQNSYREAVVVSNNLRLGERRHYYFIAGTRFKLSNSTVFKPTTFLKVTGGTPIELDLTGTFVFKDKFSVGAMYRTGDAIGMLFGVNFTEQFEVSCSYDWSLGFKSGPYNWGSAEIMLRYDLVYKSIEKIKSSRYF